MYFFLIFLIDTTSNLEIGHVNNKNWTASLIAMTSLGNRRKIPLIAMTSREKEAW